MKTENKKASTKKLPLKHWWHYPLAVLVTLLVLMYSAPLWNPLVFPPVKNPVLGVSFSDKRSREMGLDWKANFLALLDDQKIRDYRLMSYWDQSESTRGQYNFTNLDWQMNEAAKRNATVSMSIGLRQPRWPECHEPPWAKTISPEEKKQALYAYVTTVVRRYENHPALLNWQLENEGMNNWFGECGPADRQRLIDEYKLVDAISEKEIWMSLSDQHGLPTGQPRPDRYGFSVYRTVWSEKTKPLDGYVTYPTPIWYHKARVVAIKAITGKDIFIHELQLEPWGKIDTLYLSTEEQNKSMDLSKIKDNLLFAREIGNPIIYTWGGEWWYWRLQNGDPSVWNTIKDEFRKAQQ